jgi:hypothetical protein
LTDFGDAGRALPDVHLLVGARIVNLSGLAELEQAVALAQTELENTSPHEKISFGCRFALELNSDERITNGYFNRRRRHRWLRGGCCAAAESDWNIILTEESDWIGGS